MKLIDVLTERTIILNHFYDSSTTLWNSIYDLLGTNSSLSIPSSEFERNLKEMTILTSETNNNSIFCTIKSKKAEVPAVLFIRLRRPITLDDKTIVHFIVLIVMNDSVKSHISLLNDCRTIFRNSFIEKIMNNAKNTLHAFHLIKQLAAKSLVSTEMKDDTFDVYGTENNKYETN